MAQLTTIEGLAIDFDPAAVIAVADRDLDSGRAVTCVWGLGPTIARIAEPIGGFLNRLGLAGNFAKFTRPDGAAVWLCAPAVQWLRAPGPGYPANARTLIGAGSLAQAVTEDQPAAKAAIDARGGHV